MRIDRCMKTVAALSFAAALVLPAFADSTGKAAKPADNATQVISEQAPRPAAKRLSSPSELQTIRPGVKAVYGVYVEGPISTSRKVIGSLAGRQIVAIDTPVKVSGMGKYMGMDPKGNIWYVETREDKVIKINPANYEMTTYYVPKGAAPYSVAVDNDGVVWATAHGIEMLLELHPDEGYAIAHQPPSHGFLIHINVDRKSNIVWFTQPGNNQVVSYRTDLGFKEYPSPTKQSGPGRLDFDAEGNVWFPELYTDKLARLNPATGEIKEWDTPSKNALPAGARVDPVDNAVWVNEPMADALAVFKDGKWLREYKVPRPGAVVSTNTTDEEGYVWFTEGGWRGSAGGNRIGRLNPETGAIEEFELPYENSQPLGMIRGKDDSLWFALVTGARVCRVLPRDKPSDQKLAKGR